MEIEAFLSHLAKKNNVSVSSQSQAMHALLFLYNQVLDLPINDEIAPVKSRKGPQILVVMTQNEVQAVLANGWNPRVDGAPALRQWVPTDGVCSVARKGF